MRRPIAPPRISSRRRGGRRCSKRRGRVGPKRVSRPMGPSRRSRSFARAGNRIRASAPLAVLEADLCLRLRRPDEAVAAFEAALPLLPKDASIRQRLGELQRDLGQVDAALASLRDAVAVDATNASAWNALGMTLGGNGHLDEAEAGVPRGDCARRHGSSLSSSISGSSLVRQGRGRRGAAVLRENAAARARLRRRRERSFGNFPPIAAGAMSVASCGKTAGRSQRAAAPRRIGMRPGGVWIARRLAVLARAAGRGLDLLVGPIAGVRLSDRASAEPAARVARHRPRGSSGQLSLRRGADAADRRAGGVRPAIRAGDDRGAAHAARALVADDRHVSRLARRARQRRLLPRRRSAHARRDPARPGLSNRRLRRRVRARSALGHRAGLRPVLRRLRSRPVRGRVGDGHDSAAGIRGRRPRARVAAGGAEPAVLRLGPPLRRAHAVRGARAVPVALPANQGRRLRRRNRQRRRAGRAPARRASRRRPPRRHARRRRRRPRRDARRARRADARLLHLRSRDAHPADHQRSGRPGGGRRRPGAHRRRHADGPVAARGAGAEGGAGREPDAARPRRSTSGSWRTPRAGIRGITTAGASCARFKTGASS